MNNAECGWCMAITCIPRRLCSMAPTRNAVVMDVFYGTHAECVNYIRHRCPRNTWKWLAIMYVQSGRWASYVL